MNSNPKPSAELTRPETASSTRGISVQGLVVQFAKRPPVLRELQLQIEHGEIMALVGASGCGKSTLLRAIAGLISPTAGNIEFFGSTSGKMSYVFQEATLLPWRSVFDNVRLPLELRGVRDSSNAKLSVKQRVEQALRSVDLEENSWNKFPRELSGGMRMRASIARALVTDPEVLLLDEPFAALDDLLRTRMNDLILRLWHERRRTVLFVTHNIAEAAYMSHRIAVFGIGKIACVLENQLAWPRNPELRSQLAFAQQYGSISQALSTAQTVAQ